jgi:hypothetical protein
MVLIIKFKLGQIKGKIIYSKKLIFNLKQNEIIKND